MRGFALLVAGIIVGLGVAAGAQSLSPNRGIVGLSFVSLSVPNLDKAVEYYTKTLGFRKPTGSSLRQETCNLSSSR